MWEPVSMPPPYIFCSPVVDGLITYQLVWMMWEPRLICCAISDYVGVIVYLLSLSFFQYLITCLYNFHLVMSQDGLNIFYIFLLATNLCGRGHFVYILRFVLLKSIVILDHFCVGVLDPQNQCTVVP
jgi:hypothetical protein